MAIGTITSPAAGEGGASASTPVRMVSLSFAGDGAYATGGTADFEDSLKAHLGENATLLAVIENGGNGGYVVKYDRANDKLMVFESDIDSDQPLKEVDNAANLSGTTFKILAVVA